MAENNNIIAEAVLRLAKSVRYFATLPPSPPGSRRHSAGPNSPQQTEAIRTIADNLENIAAYICVLSP